MATRAIPGGDGELEEALRDRLDDEIAVLEAAHRLAQPAVDVEFDGLLDEAERKASQG